MDAIIDIGSNSVRLLLSDRPYQKRVIITRLAQNLTQSGMLSNEAMERTFEAVKTLTEEARAQNAQNIYAFATEAARRASNGQAFALELYRRLGIEVEIISGEAEALYGFSGACKNLSGPVSVIDIGGASTEISSGEDGRLDKSISLSVGTVRLFEKTNSLHACAEYIDNFLLENKKLLPPVAPHAVGIGGTITSTAAMILGLKKYDASLIDSCKIDIQNVSALIQNIKDKTTQQIMEQYPTLEYRRAQVVGFGIVLLHKLMNYYSLPSIVVSESDNMEGYYLYKKNFL